MTGAGDGSMRAGNADRERVVAQLNTAFSEGRLDVGELDERVAAAYAAKTLAELVPLTADLPASGEVAKARRAAAPVPAEDGYHGATGVNRWAPVGASLGIFLVCTLIWAAISIGQGDLTHFWPIWTAIPLVFAVLGVIGQGSARRRELGGRRRDQRRDRG
jgi:Domain of unknown function (DUF1707)